MERKRQVAEQLRALMDRHGVNPEELSRRSKDARGSTVSPVTIRRILGQEAKTEPATHTLRRLAEAMGETYAGAFPEQQAGVAEHTAAIVEPQGGKFALKFTGDELPPELVQTLRFVVDGYNAKVEAVHAAKQRGRREKKR